MKNRCDLEQDLTTFSMIIEELDLLHEMVLDGPRPMTEDEMSNYIFALHYICKLRYEKVWDTYCQVFKLDQYNTEDHKSVLDSSYPDGDEYWKEDPIKENVKSAMKAVQEERYATAELLLRDTLRKIEDE